MAELEVIQSSSNGDKAIPLLFVHGANHAAWCWNENFFPFFQSHGFQSYALSFRGHGNSEGRELLDTFTIDDYVKDVYQVLQTLEHKPVIIGHSLGGAVVQKVMQQHSDRIEAAILLASIPPEGMFKDLLRLLFTRFKDFRQLFLYNQGKTNEFPVDLFLYDANQEEKETLNQKLQQESKIATRDSIKRVVPKNTVSEVPLLVLGAEEDAMISKKTTRSVGQFYQTDPVIFPRMGHDMMLEKRWWEVAEKILAFILERRIDLENEA